MTDWRRARVPAHVGVMLGLATAGYAVTLAGVAANEAQAESAAAAERAPALATVGRLVQTNDQVTAALGQAGVDYSTVTRLYDLAAGRLTGLEAALGGLAASVADIDGVSRSLPATVSLPTVNGSVNTSVPLTHATTGASGGG